MITEDSYTGQKKTLSICEVSIIHNDIFYVLYTDNRDLTLSDFQDVRALYDEWAADKRFKLLVEFPFYTSATSEARKYAQDNPVDAIAEAIVYKSLGQRLLVKFYLKLHKQDHPVKAFKNRTKALQWLDSF